LLEFMQQCTYVVAKIPGLKFKCCPCSLALKAVNTPLWLCLYETRTLKLIQETLARNTAPSYKGLDPIECACVSVIHSE
jgi:hypothetical protein